MSRECALGWLLVIGCGPSVVAPEPVAPEPVAPAPTGPPTRTSVAAREPPETATGPELVVVSAGAVLTTLGGSTFKLPETTGPVTFVRVEERGERVVLGTDAESTGLCRPLPEWYAASDSLDLRLTVARTDILPVLTTSRSIEGKDGSSIRVAAGSEVDGAAVGALAVEFDGLSSDERAGSYRATPTEHDAVPVGWLPLGIELEAADRPVPTLEPFGTMLVPDGDGALGVPVYAFEEDGQDALVTLDAPCTRVVARVPLAKFTALPPEGGVVGSFMPPVKPPPTALLEPSRLTWADGSDAGFVLRPAPVARRSGSPCLVPNGRGPRPKLPTLCADVSAFVPLP